MDDILQQLIADALAPDAMNDVHVRMHALAKDTPGKLWWNSHPMHPAIFRALKMDRGEDGALFAAMPFRLHRSEAGARILTALPCPRFFPPGDDDWLGIETVLSWDPVTNGVEILGDTGPALIGRCAPGASAAIYSSPFRFFRAYAEARAQWLTMSREIGGDWRKRPAEPDLTPGFLVIGNPDEVKWPVRLLTDEVVCVDIDPTAVNRALLRQARIPRAVAAPQALRRAA